MKKVFSTIFLLFLSISSLFCIDTIKINSKITDVTVFSSGAQITRKFNLNFKKGKKILLLEKLPFELNPQSIQVSGVKGITILSVKHDYKLANPMSKSDEEKNIQYSIDILKNQLKALTIKINVFDIEEKLLIDNRVLSKSTKNNIVGDIKEASTFYRTRLNEIKKEKLKLVLTIDSLNLYLTLY